jgi:hypothetical protein
MTMKLKDLEDLNLITDIYEPEVIWLCKINSKEFFTEPVGPKTDFTTKCMTAVACMMNMRAGENDNICWECDAGTLIWQRKQQTNIIRAD